MLGIIEAVRKLLGQRSLQISTTCWFCGSEDDTNTDWCWSSEFDTWYHAGCLQRAWAQATPDDAETRILWQEHQVLYVIHA